MKRFKLFQGGGESVLTYRLWDFTGTALINLLIFTLLTGYLFPLIFMVLTAFKQKEQILDPSSPLYPAQAIKYNYQGKTSYLYNVPVDGGVKQWALVTPHPAYAEFIDPQNPAAGPIRWNGSWRQLKKVYAPTIKWDNFTNLWEAIDFSMAIKNTLIVAIVSEIGVLLASVAVAYGLSRFRIPGGKWLFLLLIATILIPDSITLVPTYFFFVRVLPWNGTFAPLIVPHFFGSAVYIFLLRQNFKSIPRDLDEAAMIDGAGPLRILLNIILPQSIPAVVTVALLHFFYSWNELRLASLYLGVAPELRTISLSTQFSPSVAFTPEALEASALMTLIVPVIVLFIFQRFFMKDMIVTGLEK
jgi:multiple sugar transport system permease protein